MRILFADFVASVLILLTILLAFGETDFCFKYRELMLKLYFIFGCLGLILYITEE